MDTKNAEIHTRRGRNAETRRRRRCECCDRVFTMRNPSGRARRGETTEGRFCSRRCAEQFRRAGSKELQPDLLATLEHSQEGSEA
jgi:hypothetical protein